MEVELAIGGRKMRVLVYGAGVIGANLAADLFDSGVDVSVLARGRWADTLEENGLIIKPVFSLSKKIRHIPVIRELKSDDHYDMIFVVMRYTQLDSVIPILLDNVSQNIALIGNNLCACEYRKKLKDKNILFGFYMAAGHREQERVVSISLKKITIGQLREDPSNEELIRKIFDGTKVKATYQPNMEDYLLCHAAFVVPVAFACYHCDGDLTKISRDSAYLNMIIDANIEGYQAIEDAGHEILPASDKNYHSELYRKLCYRVYKIMCSTIIGKVCASDHAMNAVEEMNAIDEGLKRFFDKHGARCPTYLQMEEDALKHQKDYEKRANRP